MSTGIWQNFQSKLMRKPNKLATGILFRRFFLWHLLTAFGMIFLVMEASAAPDEVQGVGSAPSSPEELYNAGGRRDPFVPLVSQTTRQTASGLVGVQSIDEISIQGIIYDPKKGSMVIVNGSLLKEGEEEGAVKVLKIQTDGALFSVNGIEGFKAQYPSEQPMKDQS